MTLIKIRMITYVRTRGKAFIGIDTVLLQTVCVITGYESSPSFRLTLIN